MEREEGKRERGGRRGSASGAGGPYDTRTRAHTYT